MGRAGARRGAAGELSRRCAPPRLVAELRDALDACAERQRRLERSVRACRRLLRPWEAAELPAAEPTPAPETQEEAPSPACTPSPQDLKELELLTQTLEKAVRTRIPAEGLPECRLPSAGDHTCKGRGALATKPGPGLGDQLPLAAPPAPEAFTLKEKGVLLKLPAAYRKAASQNSRLWTQLSSMQTSDSVDAATNAKTQFLQKMKMASGWPGSGLSAAEVEAEAGLLWKACSLLRQRMEEELSADCADWVQEYHCLLTLEGLQAITGQCLHRLQELRAEMVGQQLGPWPEGRCPRASGSCEGRTDPTWSSQLLLYSSTMELQTLAALRLRVAMLEQQIHLEKVLMAELLPLVSTPEAQGPPPLALCRAVHSLVCEGGERFLTILRDEPAS
ncbi:tubulin epsilon and delta complex protein 2 isoform X3 [Vulpes lagopus]|uniref:tubulin epsilon and delta complex protein 2 isoform X3 n=1 Tax=Vulpes lagopus TaxID=494514 RepID=UPI001BC99080|nr:tubulin epsilon and delta complex protein 2 isoform X3 [Vulpes lagopus]